MWVVVENVNNRCEAVHQCKDIDDADKIFSQILNDNGVYAPDFVDIGEYYKDGYSVAIMETI